MNEAQAFALIQVGRLWYRNTSQRLGSLAGVPRRHDRSGTLRNLTRAIERVPLMVGYVQHDVDGRPSRARPTPESVASPLLRVIGKVAGVVTSPAHAARPSGEPFFSGATVRAAPRR